MKRWGPVGIAVLGMGLLLWQGPLCAGAVRRGITLCLETVIPALFPFLFLSKLFSGSYAGELCCKWLGPVVRRLFRLPEASAQAMVLGVLGGYPVGAKTAGELYRQDRISLPQAKALLGFCSNAGPGFVLGMVQLVVGLQAAAMLLGIHILSAMVVGVLISRSLPVPQKTAPMPREPLSFPQILMDSLRSIGAICGCVVLFGILTELLGETGLPMPLIVLLTGLLELTSGIRMLVLLPAGIGKLCAASLFLGFGGICVWMQTNAVLPSKLRGGSYIGGKCLQATFSVFLTAAAASSFPGAFGLEARPSFPLWVGIGLAALVFFLVIAGIRGRNLEKAKV